MNSRQNSVLCDQKKRLQMRTPPHASMERAMFCGAAFQNWYIRRESSKQGPTAFPYGRSAAIVGLDPSTGWRLLCAWEGISDILSL